MSQVFNFSAGPAMIFPEVLQKHKMNLQTGSIKVFL